MVISTGHKAVVWVIGLDSSHHVQMYHKTGQLLYKPHPLFFCTRSPDGACDTYSFLHCSALTPSLSTILFLLNPTPLSFPPSVPPITPGGATVVRVVPVCRDGGGEQVAESAPAGETTESTGSGFYNRRLHNYPLIKYSDMNEEMRVEAMELCVTACEKHSSSNEAAAKMIKETMDKKFGLTWHAVVGVGFGFEITHDVKNLLYMFFGGNTAICLWKCA